MNCHSEEAKQFTLSEAEGKNLKSESLNLIEAAKRQAE